MKNHKNKNWVFIVMAIQLVACSRSTEIKRESPEKQVQQNEIYTAPDYSKLGYKEIEFTGEGSQADMNNEVYENLQRAEKRMQTILDSIHMLYNQAGVFSAPKFKDSFFKSLEFSQKQWELYAEGMVELKYPKEEEGGTATGMSIARYKIDLVNQRIRDLNPWLMGIPQGDVGSGTVRLLDYSWNAIRNSETK